MVKIECNMERFFGTMGMTIGKITLVLVSLGLLSACAPTVGNSPGRVADWGRVSPQAVAAADNAGYIGW